ncbi:MAG: aminotransferase class I/II-fold pyridoxal phosphate-dependent enzyme [Lentimicrobium sp.]|jgi:aromatic-L-amino-acid decarboxylase|uniref:pyridoxal phosphate-dependent decarboxylase family protein n=1 Tax=Lentimicrobium sp. TaxID=2034841 RepID=UPI0025EED212|nr:aminotransferase class I/II-fold pyridoxal phosphate-dependent enzyme [Lentimicrobium sp.]MCO5258068.1 aminotransferase class I/II-fold pyridoxal phosphate-dependent enzyme [Lentimicrobium sp.]
MNIEEFRAESHRMADRIADYFELVSSYPVKSQVQPGEILDALPQQPPAVSESMDSIMADFERIIMPGITHWQSPSFFAYFPANSSYPSVLAEMLTSALAQQGMIWETSPAATELEDRVMEWLKQIFGLPETWTGVIQDTASASTLAALLTARERATDWNVNDNGFAPEPGLRIYCSLETHSSIEKAAKIAGYGKNNLIKVAVKEDGSMDAGALEKAIGDDLHAGLKPVCVVGTLGTTGTTANDPLEEIGAICQKFNLWFHVDAAYGGTALMLPEMRHLTAGLKFADSYVFNPHKWMFTNFDCSAYFVRDTEALTRTFSILPEYLRTATRGQVKDYRDWGVALGRRFRALKLWFVIRSFGVEGLREKVRKHLDLARWLSETIENTEEFELLAPVNYSLVCFRYRPEAIADEEKLNQINQQLLQKVNQTGRLYITHTKIAGKYTLRLVIAQTYVERHHVEAAWSLIRKTASRLSI